MLCDNLPITKECFYLNAPPKNYGKLRLHSKLLERFFLHLDGDVRPATQEVSAILQVSDYTAKLPSERGTQAFYHNLGYQLGHMGIPIIVGQKNPASLGYFMHRVGQMPVACLKPEWLQLIPHIAPIKNKTQPDLLKHFSDFSFTVQIHNQAPEAIVDPKFLPQLNQLQDIFNKMSPAERRLEYHQQVKNIFSMSK